MKKTALSALIFDEDDVRSTVELLPRLIRVVFFGLSITNHGYLERYRHSFRNKYPNRSKKEFTQKATSDRKFLTADGRDMTFKAMQTVIDAMGYNIVAVDIKIKDRITGEVREFSTTDTVDSLKKIIANGKEIGIQSLI